MIATSRTGSAAPPARSASSACSSRCCAVELAAGSMSPPECQSAARELAALQKASMSALDRLLQSEEQRTDTP
ncbi:hypothetical protein [Bradyrhizobium sp. SEMIA]|uniref:hypothetical protein n=1 Tax=Bradyrhizobium sp. SEMIA TaxID=2597515 RepID=UPI00223F6461|nr:hypothetical protein [Bradyrhizobium sp. SEMIA]